MPPACTCHDIIDSFTAPIIYMIGGAVILTASPQTKQMCSPLLSVNKHSSLTAVLPRTDFCAALSGCVLPVDSLSPANACHTHHPRAENTKHCCFQKSLISNRGLGLSRSGSKSWRSVLHIDRDPADRASEISICVLPGVPAVC